MTDTPRWIRAVRCEDIPLREGRSVRMGSYDIAIFNLGDRFLAVANRCPHKGGPLSEGIVSGGDVVCPLHAWKVELETGAILRPAENLSCVETFRTRVQNGVISLELPVEPNSQDQTGDVCTERRGKASGPEQKPLPLKDPDGMYVGATTGV
jgi:nitrite reductase (NADH) small subunit